jgi:hypothetical protein
MTTNRWTAADIPNQAGRIFLVTGANSGLGYVTARELARAGAHVIMTARNEAKGREALERLRAGQSNASVELRHLDLADLDSVKTFAEAIIVDRVPVDVLINNAGIMMPPRSLTRQGFELQFGTNHLGHFALTSLLLESLTAGSDARVVTVSSTAHKSGFIHFDDLTGERSYSRWAFYAQSKSPTSSSGWSWTAGFGIAGCPSRASWRFIAQDVEIGALNQLYAATHPRAESGQFIGPDGRWESRGYPTIVQPIDGARDRETAKHLWNLSEELTGVHFELTVAA